MNFYLPETEVYDRYSKALNGNSRDNDEQGREQNDEHHCGTNGYKINDMELEKANALLIKGVQCSTLNELVVYLHRVFDEDQVNIEFVHMLMSSYKSNPAEWLKFAKFDKHRYTRNLVDTGNGKFNLIILCWGEGHGSSIHDHSNSHCFMKMLAGSLCETKFEWPEKELDEQVATEPAMKETSKTILNTDEVCYINDSIGLHRVENLSYTDRAVSLHLYCPPFDSCHVFNQNTGRKTKAQVVFWSISGERQRKSRINRDSSPEDN